MHGLIRVRQFTLSEGHIICTPEQLEDEFKGVLDLVYYMMDCLGLKDNVTYRFSKWDPNNKEKYIDDPACWNKAEALMEKILDDIGLDYTVGVGEAAFYGPKLDIQAKNVFGKEDTIITIQVDLFLAENFDMTYIDADGERKRPYIIHRSSIGCYERTIAMLIEKYAGAFPLWLSPTQVKILTLTDRTADAARELKGRLERAGSASSWTRAARRSGTDPRGAAGKSAVYADHRGQRGGERRDLRPLAQRRRSGHDGLRRSAW